MSKDPVIESKIPLTDALGVTKGMTGKQVSERWVDWGKKYPKEKKGLSPAVIASLDTLAAIVKIQELLETIPSIIETVVTTAGKAYDIALSVLPGIGGANGAKIAAQDAMVIIKGKIADLIVKMRELPQNVYESLTNLEVDENAIL